MLIILIRSTLSFVFTLAGVAYMALYLFEGMYERACLAIVIGLFASFVVSPTDEENAELRDSLKEFE